ncbi:MAG TPA: FkbM family methyltransferase [Nitrospiraceae bacterium]|nr:FkbM family methyltransferase [Nitrospiraceae bacterium]
MITIRTSQKITLARWAYFGLTGIRRLLGLSSMVQAKRNGMRWHLDLQEGIDFSIYVLGAFEPKTVRLYEQFVKPGDVVLDIGANVGAHTLPLARLVGDKGRVIAFEPTDYAMQKLLANIALNPSLIQRIEAHQVMLVSSSGDAVETGLYSSWPLVARGNVHKKHQGRLMATTGAASSTLDQWVKTYHVDKVNFVKLDVDGHEYSVLAGGRQTLGQYKPIILMELEPCLYDDEPANFDGLLQIVDDLGYSLRDVNTGKSLPNDPHILRQLIPDGASRNVLAAVSFP